jgi:hypothetical protein
MSDTLPPNKPPQQQTPCNNDDKFIHDNTTMHSIYPLHETLMLPPLCNNSTITNNAPYTLPHPSSHTYWPPTILASIHKIVDQHDNDTTTTTSNCEGDNRKDNQDGQNNISSVSPSPDDESGEQAAVLEEMLTKEIETVTEVC